jgi:hypothetical protein
VDTTGTVAAYLSWTDASGTSYDFFPDLVISEKWQEDCAVTEHPIEQGANIVDHVRVELLKCELTIFATNEPIGPNSFQVPQTVGVQLEGPPGPGFVVPGPPIAKEWISQLGLRSALLGAGGAIGGAVGGALGTAVGGLAGSLLGSLFSDYELDTPISNTVTLTAAPQVIGQAQLQQFSDSQGETVLGSQVIPTTTDFVEATISVLEQLKDTAQIISLNGSKEVCSSMVIESFAYTRSSDEGTGATITIGFKEIRIVQTQSVTAPLRSFPRAATPVNAGPQNGGDGSAAQQESAIHQIASALGLGGP